MKSGRKTGIPPARPCGDPVCGHGDTRHLRGGLGECRNPGCKCRGFVQPGQKPIGVFPPVRMEDRPQLPPVPVAGAVSAAPAAPVQAQPVPEPQAAQAPPPAQEAELPPIDVPPLGGSSGEPPPSERETELRERQRKAELFAAGVCAFTLHGQEELRKLGFPVTIPEQMIKELQYPALVRTFGRWNTLDAMSSEELDEAFGFGPAVATALVRIVMWFTGGDEDKKPPPPAPSPSRIVEARSEPVEPPPPRPRPTETDNPPL